MAGSNAAVVVAFNRKQLLAECLDGLLRQSLPLDAIFVIDNASTDGTDAYLEERGYLAKPEIRYIRLSENGGGAGGFYRGVREAAEAGYDWIWLMDDDTEPEPDALRRMEPLKAHAEVVAIANHKCDTCGKETWDGLRLLKGTGDPSRPYVRVKFSSFVGLLIRSEAVRKIGLPKPEFFIHSDDTDYCFRLRKVGEIAAADDSRVVHKEKARPVAPRSILGYKYVQKDLYSYCFDYFTHRNYLIVRRMHGGLFTGYLVPLRRFVLEAIAIMLLERGDRLQRYRILMRAIRDGFQQRFDNAYPFRLREQLRAEQG